MIFSTTDGGRHWRLRRTEKGTALLAVAIGDARHVYAVGGSLVSTQDGGFTWNSRHLASKSLGGFTAVAAQGARAWAAEYGGRILTTRDGGKAWASQSFRGVHLVGIAFGDALNGWVCSSEGVVLSTEDGGVIWKRSGPPDLGGLLGVAARP